jgi:hypothetical protein
MGKPKKGGYPPPQGSTRYVHIQGGQIEDKTIAWGDWVVWMNLDRARYTLVLSEINGKPVQPPAPVWATLTEVGTPDANSSPRQFYWPGAPPKDPYVYTYAMQQPPNSKGVLTVQINVPPEPSPSV